MLCMVLTFGMGVTAVQADASILSHIACGDSQLSDGGWVCNCEPDEEGCLRHLSDDVEGQDGDHTHHHHHAEAPSSTAPAPDHVTLSRLWADIALAMAQTEILHGIAPSQADQPPRV